MKFKLFFLNKTPLFIAVENNCLEIVKLLLLSPNIDVNISCISNSQCFHTIHQLYFK